MNAVTNTWRQLVRNKLWPVALLLLAALVAVPVLLAREPVATEPLTPLAVSTEADDTIAEPVVAEVTAEDRDRRRRVLGVRKDPFAPAPPKKTKAQPTTSRRRGPRRARATPGTGGSTDVGTGGEPAEAPTTTSPARSSSASARRRAATLTRLAIPKFGAVPDPELPLLVYMGLTRDGKKAKFLVDASVEVDGDGDCKPHPGNCETILLAVGETEFLDVLNPETDEDSEETEEEEEWKSDRGDRGRGGARDPRHLPARPRRHQARRRLRRSIGVCAIRRGFLREPRRRV